ncbi:MAG: type 1 glutamine amidotransferase [Deltaproteobacteria bacterium]|nr:type 1 glutamine amidotransferase [Deltaproteobacteria bacterium]
MKNVLVIVHGETSGSEIFWQTLISGGAYLRTVNLFKGDQLPERIHDFDGIISLGGLMNAADDDRCPFIKTERAFLKKAIGADIPVLGSSLGARLIAQACSAEISALEGTRPDWDNVLLTNTGKRDILFYGLPRSMWFPNNESESFELPCGATLLATSKSMPNQAFRYHNAYGLHFSIEGLSGRTTGECSKSEVLFDGKTLSDLTESFYMQTRGIYLNFLWLADMRAKAFDSEMGSERWLIGQAEFNNWKIA